MQFFSISKYNVFGILKKLAFNLTKSNNFFHTLDMFDALTF